MECFEEKYMIDFNNCKVVALNDNILSQLTSWRYDSPYDIYNLNLSDYLLDKSTWGIEQFAMIDKNKVIAQLAYQIYNDEMWVGWSLNPKLCGNKNGRTFVDKCIKELINLSNYNNEYIYLKVIDWNIRAIKSYEKAGFSYYKDMIKKNNNESIKFYIMRKEIKN